MGPWTAIATGRLSIDCKIDEYQERPGLNDFILLASEGASGLNSATANPLAVANSVLEILVQSAKS